MAKQVLSKKELNKKDKESSGKFSPKVSEKPKPVKQKKNQVFECPFAPMGKSSTSIEYWYEKNGAKISYKKQIDLVNKKYTIPDDLKDRDLMIAALKKNGFIDVTEFPQNEKGRYIKNENKFLYLAVHPLHTDRKPLNGNIAMALKDDNGHDKYDKDGNQITTQLVVKNGSVTTGDKNIYRGLLDSGFLPAGQEVVE